MRRALGLLVVATLVVACTDGGAGDKAADQKLADAALLSLDDLPEDFRVEPYSSEPTDGSDRSEESDYADDEAFFGCLGAVWTEEDNRAGPPKEARARYWKPLDALTIRASVTYYKNQDFPAKLIDAFSGETATDCMDDAFSPVPGENGGELVTVVSRPDLPAIGDQQMSFVLEMRATLMPQLALRQGTYAVRVGRALVSLRMSSMMGPLDDDLAADALTAMVERLEDT